MNFDPKETRTEIIEPVETGGSRRGSQWWRQVQEYKKIKNFVALSQLIQNSQ